MGQQQLLLLVLSALIVGFSIVAGISVFGESAYQANREAVLDDVVTIASWAQEWYRTPSLLGGGNRSFNGLNDLILIGFPDSTSNGKYSIAGSGESATITATGQEDGDGDGSPFKLTTKVFLDSIGTPNFTNK